MAFKMEMNIPKITQALEKEMEAALKKSVYRIHRELISKILVGKRSGREYPVPATSKRSTQGTSAGEGKKPKKTVYYTASAPGEAPASRLGDLRTSYRPIVEGRGMNATGKVGTPMEYGQHLEYGTVHMAKRPHLRRAFDESQKEWEKFFEDLL